MFKKAVKSQSRLRLALVGPAGSGKTYTALSVATHLHVGPIAVIDTEHGSASKYADLFEFEVVNLDSFHPNKYIEAINAAQAGGFGIVIVDSLSHAWVGKDGALELHDRAVARQKTQNKFTAWGEITPLQNRLIDTITGCKIHLISTIRSKTEYVQENGKVRKVGMAPVQRDGAEYEFDIIGDMDIDNRLIVSKTRCPQLAGGLFERPGKEFAGIINQWLSSGEAMREEPKPSANGTNGKTPESPAVALLKKTGWERDVIVAYLRSEFGVSRLSELNADQTELLIGKLENTIAAQSEPRITPDDADQLDMMMTQQGFGQDKAADLLREFGIRSITDLPKSKLTEMQQRITGSLIPA